MAEAALASSSSRLEPFVLLAKSAKGMACAKLIQDALSAPGVFVFSELLETPSVQELRGTANEPSLILLELFAYGSYQEYKERSANLPPLNEAQTKKLKHLSMVTMSGANRTLKYDALQHYLDIPNVRELEDLIIDAIYQDVIKGKLDQKRKALEVEYAMGRDLKPGESECILQTLSEWSKTSQRILDAIDAQTTKIVKDAQDYKKEKEDFEARLEVVKKDVKASGQSRGSMHESFDMRPEYGDFGDDSRRGQKRNAKGGPRFGDGRR
ncbi:hypothetical protein HK097_008583 [Rhizophlyctis rosea]|uniref:PCI domain-containing protein n=1 Tax=Rhizophlyctis rosea TaxID=64517 RepID=A0AAD5SJH7_9FUNG|nr:hypothetical protein HK097_008583 [Rhizophlyctis rosea]